MSEELKETVEAEQTSEARTERIESDIQESWTHYQDLKVKFTDYDHDLLAYREPGSDATRANFASPDPYSDVRSIKGRLKSAILSSYPYAYAVPKSDVLSQEDKELLGYQQSYFYSDKLLTANFPFYLDQWLLDPCRYGTVFPTMMWKRGFKPMPVFEDTPYGKKPVYQNGRRLFQQKLVYDNIELGTANIDDVYLPPYCADVLKTPWLAIKFRSTIEDLARQTFTAVIVGQNGEISYEERPLYTNLDKLKEKKKTYEVRSNSEWDRKKQAIYQKVSCSSSRPSEFWLYFTPWKIYVKPVGEKFFIREDDNTFQRIPVGVGYITQLPNEPYGIGLLAPVHKMNRYSDEMINVMLDQLFQENFKMWLVAANSVPDNELRAGLGAIIHANVEEGGDVRSKVAALETRAIASEILPFHQFFNLKRQMATGAVDALKGTTMQPNKTATQSSFEFQGATGAMEDYLQNLEGSLGFWLFDMLQHLCQLNYSHPESVSVYGNDDKIYNQIDVAPEQIQVRSQFRFQWAGRERARDIERASLTNVLQVMGQISPEAYMVNPVLFDIIKEIIILSPIRNADILVKKLEASIQKMSQMLPQGMPSGNGGSQAQPEIINRLSQILRGTAEQNAQRIAPNMEPR